MLRGEITSGLLLPDVGQPDLRDSIGPEPNPPRRAPPRPGPQVGAGRPGAPPPGQGGDWQPGQRPKPVALLGPCWLLPLMGNSQCVPQAPRRLRASFSRKSSLKGSREDSARRLAGPSRDSAADKLFHYVPGPDIPGLQNQDTNLEQPFLSIYKRARRRVPVKELGKVIHYAKVRLRFLHSQDVSDCFLELFPSHLYFQAHGAEGLTFQGLLPLAELSVCRLEGSREYAFQITGPLPAPLLVLCPSEAELGHWLYHLEKQMALVGGLRRCHSAPPQAPPRDELPWTLHRHLAQLWTAPGRESAGNPICASRVKLQHLPSQEQWDRLLVLYSASLAIFSEEPDGLCFKGELPLSAIHINLEEKEKQIRSFLIEGPLINTIRVLCASYEDYSHWLLCLRTASRRDGAPMLPGPESCLVPAQNQDHPDYGSLDRQRAELRRRDSGRLPRAQTWAQRPGPAVPPPLHLDLTKVSCLGLEGSPEAPDSSLEPPQSPLYADPYTPPATSHCKITNVQGLNEFLSAMQSSPGPEPTSPLPTMPVSIPVCTPASGTTGPHVGAHKAAPQPRAPQRPRGSTKGRRPRPSASPQLVSSSREGPPSPPLPPPDGCFPGGHKGPSYEDVWDKTPPASHRKWPQQLAQPEAEGSLPQWI
ncbi:pleckstrin homology domain-containing family N member 1 isoform X2 [Ochotona princeps]|uniref:pleckstrin homology domain-containing family N member 1 isoform X2 n=1 Tax=Ochotona princeps TaxID=9978 RepID=UPI0027145438|nr:pleckstrin homology domain-containing family N member 1 isoform X2 [Ochotona princeps]